MKIKLQQIIDFILAGIFIFFIVKGWWLACFLLFIFIILATAKVDITVNADPAKIAKEFKKSKETNELN